ncbi:HEAT repeat domain-containing protein [Rhodopirellula bahusiensis]|uniref:EF-hand domain-containing protein n=1 Tax=Rhodopirellula bahusiensis TaxID=2014065 RepID=A0A2G1W465_9BACT|nr:HEAT repeat domain-containing protein [Rhodopirellula bahusiensis]PHQ33640.1 hypothetical protein CEE69_18810 [Rhodopirellula bahusiensis]
MWKLFHASSIVLVLAFCAQSSKAQSEDSESEDREAESSAATEMGANLPEQIVDRLFEMSVDDPATAIRMNALKACANIPNEGTRLNDAVDRSLNASDLKVRLNAIQMLELVELKPQRKVDAAIEYLELRFQNPDRRIPFNHPTISPAVEVLKRHSEVANATLSDKLRESSPSTLLHLQLAGLLKFNVAENADRLHQHSKSDNQEVRGEVVALWSKHLANAAAKRSQPEKQPQPELTEKLNGINPKFLKYAETIIRRYDKDESRSLHEQEWQSMLMNPASADLNHDGHVTIEEYALHIYNRSKK